MLFGLVFGYLCFRVKDSWLVDLKVYFFFRADFFRAAFRDLGGLRV